MKCPAQGPESSIRVRISYYSSWAATLVDLAGCPGCDALPGGQGPEKCSGALGTALVEQFSHLASFQSSEVPPHPPGAAGMWAVPTSPWQPTSIWENLNKNQEGSGKGQQKSLLTSGLRGTPGS